MAIDEIAEVLSRNRSQSGRILRGVLVAVSAEGDAVVRLGDDLSSLEADSLVTLVPDDAGREAVVAFLDADPKRPVILGLLQDRRQPAPRMRVDADGERIVIRGEREIVLKCGKASLTLTRAGKVLIRGAYVLSRSSGVNRIKGGSVQIN